MDISHFSNGLETQITARKHRESEFCIIWDLKNFLIIIHLTSYPSLVRPHLMKVLLPYKIQSSNCWGKKTVMNATDVLFWNRIIS